MKQWDMGLKIEDNRIRFFIGDVRDKDRLHRALDGVDYVYMQLQPRLFPLLNIILLNVLNQCFGAMNLIDACIDKKVKKVIALSTDKASSPITYRATKLASDKLFVAANSYSGQSGTEFSVVRYGNYGV